MFYPDSNKFYHISFSFDIGWGAKVAVESRTFLCSIQIQEKFIILGGVKEVFMFYPDWNKFHHISFSFDLGSEAKVVVFYLNSNKLHHISFSFDLGWGAKVVVESATSCANINFICFSSKVFLFLTNIFLHFTTPCT